MFRFVSCWMACVSLSLLLNFTDAFTIPTITKHSSYRGSARSGEVGSRSSSDRRGKAFGRDLPLKKIIETTNIVLFASSSSLSAGFGISTSWSTKDAVREAVAMAQNDLGLLPNTNNDEDSSMIAFVSCTVRRDVEDVRKEFIHALPNENIILHGITSSGTLLTAKKGAIPEGIDGGSPIGCLLIRAADTSSHDKSMFTSLYDSNNENSKRIAEQFKRKCIIDNNLQPQLILMSATPGAEEHILQSLHEHFPGVPIYGGTAADDELVGEWKVMSREGSSTTGVHLIAINGNRKDIIKVSGSMIGPYTETSNRVLATKTEGRRVYEINNQPANDWVYGWLGEEVKEQYTNGGLILPITSTKPIGYYNVNDDGNPTTNKDIITTHLAGFGNKQMGENYIEFFAPIPENAELIIMDSRNGPDTGYANALCKAYDIAYEGLQQESIATSSSSSSSSSTTPSTSNTAPVAGILIFCGGMAIAVGDNLNTGLTNHEFVAKVNDLPLLGMTCFGEQAFLTNSKENVQRNLSVGMILFGQ